MYNILHGLYDILAYMVLSPMSRQSDVAACRVGDPRRVELRAGKSRRSRIFVPSPSHVVLGALSLNVLKCASQVDDSMGT